MATLTVTFPDEVVPRIQMAMGHTDTESGERVPATVQEIQAATKAFIKSQVINYESTLAGTAKREEVANEDWD